MNDARQDHRFTLLLDTKSRNYDNGSREIELPRSFSDICICTCKYVVLFSMLRDYRDDRICQYLRRLEATYCYEYFNQSNVSEEQM